MKEIIDISELRSVQLGILKHIDSFCKQNGIKYFLSGGTMIGAVRHHGYIPWDDDIDIMLLRDDYEKLIALYSKIDNSKYKIHCFENDLDYSFPFAKIDNSDTLLEEEVVETIKGMGVNIDIFPIDDIPNEMYKQWRLYNKLKLYMGLMVLKNVEYSKSRVWYKNLILYLSRSILRSISLQKLVKKIHTNAIKYRGAKTDYCGVAVWGYGMREINLRRNWDNVIEMPFEDMMAPIPEGYDNYLTCVYGDYMKLPPEEKRVTHHGFKAWWK